MKTFIVTYTYDGETTTMRLTTWSLFDAWQEMDDFYPHLEVDNITEADLAYH
jgi:hypothetical protein